MFETNFSICGELWSREETRKSSLLVRTTKDLPVISHQQNNFLKRGEYLPRNCRKGVKRRYSVCVARVCQSSAVRFSSSSFRFKGTL